MCLVAVTSTLYMPYSSARSQASEIVRFELDEKKLSELLAQVADVDKAIKSQTHT